MATSGVTTNVSELPESRVRVEAEVAPEEIDKQIAIAAKSLGRQLRVPGFRNGKVPAPIVIQRMGRDAILDDAVRDSLPAWYSAAIDDARIVPIGDPDIDLGEMPTEGKPLTFSIEIGVRPAATLGKYKNLKVGKPSTDVADEAIDTEISELRDRAGRLEAVDRPAAKGDFVVMDFVGSIDDVPFEGGEARDHMLELGSGQFIGNFEEQLEGVSAGDEKTITVTFPDEYQAEHLAGKDAQFAVTVKEIKAKELPELDDDFALEQGHDTLDELREEIRARLAETLEKQSEARFRENALDAAVENATVDLPDALVQARAKELWENMVHTLSHQGINREMYLQIAGKTEDEIVEEAKPDASKHLKREAVLAAIVEAEGIDPTDEELLEALAPDAERANVSAKKLLERVKSGGRLDALKEDVSHSTAIDRLVESATAVDAPAEDPEN
jgi:trigger factor